MELETAAAGEPWDDTAVLVPLVVTVQAAWEVAHEWGAGRAGAVVGFDQIPAAAAYFGLAAAAVASLLPTAPQRILELEQRLLG